MRYFLCIALFVLALLFPSPSRGEYRVEALFPYSLTGDNTKDAPAGSTQLLMVSIESFHNDEDIPVQVHMTAPEGFQLLSENIRKGAAAHAGVIDKVLPAQYGQTFLSVPVALPITFPKGEETLQVIVSGGGERVEKEIPFSVTPPEAKEDGPGEAGYVSWYIQGLSFPVNEEGNRDARQERNTLVVRDVMLETLWHRFTGGGIDWSEELARPAGYLLLELRNPGKSKVPLKALIQLTDKHTGEERPGFIPAGSEEGEMGRSAGRANGTEAMIGLAGNVIQIAAIPVYVDPFLLVEGDYTLRVTLSDGTNARVQELPVSIVKGRGIGIGAVLFAFVCLGTLLLSIGALRRCIQTLGARGDITVALFAALAFGGVVVPVTLIGDFLQVILGPFSGLVTGLLSGVIQYILLMALLVLFRKPGVAALFFIIRWLLSAILFGRVSPVGILVMAVSAVVIECALHLAGFFRKKELSHGYCLGMALVMGVCDAFITLINMEQIMLFYRLYYADWFIGLYMLVNGLIYSSVGSSFGFAIGSRLRQVVRE